MSPGRREQIRSRWKATSVRVLKLAMLILSVLSGALFAIVWRNYELAVTRLSNLHSPMEPSAKVRQTLEQMPPRASYQEWLARQGLQSEVIPHEDLSYGNGSQIASEASWLTNHTRVLCMVLTTSRHRAKALNNTWTRHCNDVIFYGRYHEKKLPYVKLKLFDDNLFSPRTFCLAFIDLINRKSNFDWLLITTDHTYAIVENLRHYVAPYTEVSRSTALYLGRPVHHYFLGTFNAYDSGIILSLASVNLLANTAFLNRTTCVHLQDGQSLVLSGSFDAYIGAQLAKHGVKPANTLDGQESRFHPFMPEKHIRPQTISVFDSYWTSNVLPVTGGVHCCSAGAITFTGFSAVTMYFLEYLTYHLTAFTEADGQLGLGNVHPASLYQVPSEVKSKKHHSSKSSSHRLHKHKHSNRNQ